MKDVVTFEVDGQFIGIEVERELASLEPAGAEAVVDKVRKPFEAAIGVLGSLATTFAHTLKDRPVSSAEIKLSLKMTAKGDFILVGSSAEAVLEVKLTITPGV